MSQANQRGGKQPTVNSIGQMLKILQAGISCSIDVAGRCGGCLQTLFGNQTGEPSSCVARVQRGGSPAGHLRAASRRPWRKARPVQNAPQPAPFCPRHRASLQRSPVHRSHISDYLQLLTKPQASQSQSSQSGVFIRQAHGASLRASRCSLGALHHSHPPLCIVASPCRPRSPPKMSTRPRRPRSATR